MLTWTSRTTKLLIILILTMLLWVETTVMTDEERERVEEIERASHEG